MWWALSGAGALVILVGGLSFGFGMHARKLARQLGEARGEIESLKAELFEERQENDALELALDRALESRPSADELRDTAAAEIAARGGLSEVEQRAVDRLLRARAAGPAGESAG